jgi:transcription elongation factor GreA
MQYLTPEGLEKLKKELKYLENDKRKEIAELINHTAAFGDLKENAAYDEAKDAQGFLERRIIDLRDIISSAKLIDKSNKTNIQVGSVVILSANNKKEQYHIVGPAEVDVFKGKISYESPLGSLILNKNRGDTIVLKTPAGKTIYKILEIN